ncbi:hypothetical protein GmHk_04G009539 [Glycine max]|uniref:Uncharacterized protein n=2 Tax=Glycine subgen. Soja TaxID=1462606 RepID=A0A0R0K870_SOYBN|nr:hypothetical protein GmHk_04G009539 [Glycine max]KHN29721.1 hypothetical protein glysoja_016343 [Glycine soja]RZC15115.1 hypothetical protein D0Y65_008826 [Glycine soja]
MALMEENASSTEALTRKLDEILTETENDVGQFSFEEEAVEKFMQELYKEIIASPPTPSEPPSSSNVLQVQNDSIVAQDEGDFDDDEWLARVLSSGQAQFSKQYYVYVAPFLRCFWGTKFRSRLETQPSSSQLLKRNSACA